MKLKFLDARHFEASIKCTVQSNGKLNFSSSAIKVLSLNNKKSVKFALNQDAKVVEQLYIQIQDKITDDAFKVNKAGNYFYLNAKVLFDTIGLDYKTHTVIFDIKKTDSEIDGLPMFQLIQRKGKSRKAK